ncbi:MAG: Beta-galactosidase [Lacunisphaera sp.]|nr:Beta-galactosidase [Lacunisphaera sp.]
MQQSLNGLWEIAESSSAEPPPTYERTVPVPGLARLATPPFPGLSVREIGWLPLETRQRARVDPRRDYFWYRRTFSIASEYAVALLRFAKAQFGIRVWLNGKVVGEDHACFSSAIFDITRDLVAGDNELVVRVGAHPLILPAGVPTGSDHEKYLWTAGLYDNVELILSGVPTIESVQVAPDLVRNSITVTWTACNRSDHAVNCAPRLSVATRAGQEPQAEKILPSCVLGARETKQFTDSISIANARWWSPEDPFLYELTIITEGDRRNICFGMREFRFDTVTRRAWLNGRIYYLRGTNITLHRFFEDEACGTLPWDQTWVRKLLGELPKRYHWNIMRWSIGAVPECWLQIADEVGLLVEYEFPIWTWRTEWNQSIVLGHIKRWMADSWNHPSLVWWSMSNETRHVPLIQMVAEVRVLDLSHRPWSNGYNLPEGEHDPLDDHPYKWHAPVAWPAELWSDEKYAAGTAENTANAPHPSAHASVANEYCWFWLRRGGETTELTAGVYARYFSRARSPEQRRELYAYYLAAETEYLRAHRNFAGVMHFVFLTCDHPWALTGDLFEDVARLKMHDVYDVALRHAFHPLGVYLNHWERSPAGGTRLTLHAMLVNDDAQPHHGELAFAVEKVDGEPMTEAVRLPFAISSLGQHTFRCDALCVPEATGVYFLTATARSSAGAIVTSRRQIEVQSRT